MQGETTRVEDAPPPPEPPTVYTVDQVAEHLHRHYKTVLGYIKRGELGHVRFAGGRKLGVRADQLSTFINDHTINGNGDR